MTEDERPAIEQLLARLCGGVITGKDYVGYFLNEHGEELVFAQSRGEDRPVLAQRCRLADVPRRRPLSTGRQRDGRGGHRGRPDHRSR
ncbi:hypothetical protein ACFQ2K_30420 [Streptomyces sanglieri]|uniref:Uncharacterized protein n=1 Tax=Streptomyces sanglieri TaxID=193460 RepID=A0ABW2WXX8_9ACTN